MNWVEEAKVIFRAEKPEHFTNFAHCEECAEHDRTLISSEIDSISLDELGNPGWDPLCFCSVEGKKYLTPALIRLSLETMDEEFYLSQLLFHLEADGEDNQLVRSCTPEQRQFVAGFIAHLVQEFAAEIERNNCTDQVLRVHAIWSKA